MSQFTDKLRYIGKALEKDDQHLVKNDDLIPEFFKGLADELEEIRAAQGKAP